MAAQQLPGGGGERVDVTGGGRFGVLEQLGRHVINGVPAGSRPGPRREIDTGHSEVDERGSAELVDHDVGWLHVTVHYASLVRHGERATNAL